MRLANGYKFHGLVYHLSDHVVTVKHVKNLKSTTLVSFNEFKVSYKRYKMSSTDL